MPLHRCPKNHQAFVRMVTFLSMVLLLVLTAPPAEAQSVQRAPVYLDEDTMEELVEALRDLSPSRNEGDAERALALAGRLQSKAEQALEAGEKTLYLKFKVEELMVLDSEVNQRQAQVGNILGTIKGVEPRLLDPEWLRTQPEQQAETDWQNNVLNRLFDAFEGSGWEGDSIPEGNVNEFYRALNNIEPENLDSKNAAFIKGRILELIDAYVAYDQLSSMLDTMLDEGQAVTDLEIVMIESAVGTDGELLAHLERTVEGFDLSVFPRNEGDYRPSTHRSTSIHNIKRIRRGD